MSLLQVPPPPQLVRQASACVLRQRRSPQRNLCMASICEAFEAAGGLATSDEVVTRMRACLDQPISALARLITTRSIVSFRGHANLLIPLFQFDLARMVVRADVACVTAELALAYDDLELATWFSRPNAWLENATPVALCAAGSAAAVLKAARTDRFVVAG